MAADPSSVSSSTKFPLKPSEASNVLLRSLQRLYSEKKLFDVSISCNGRILFGCHKLVLASCSTYFETLLSTTDGIAILNLDAVDGEYVKHLHTIVNFMYGHTIVVPKSELACHHLYEAARIFGVTALIKTLDIQWNGCTSFKSAFSARKRGVIGRLDANNPSELPQGDEVMVLKSCGIGSMLLVNFQRYKDNEKFIDAKICCRDQVLFTCHKLVLASFSGYFETLLSNTEGSAILNLDAVDSLYVQQLSTLIDYMYGQATWVKAEDLELMQDAAHVFGVQSLEKGDLARLKEARERNLRNKSLAKKLDELRNVTENGERGNAMLYIRQGSTTIHLPEDSLITSVATPVSSVGAVEEVSTEETCLNDDGAIEELNNHCPETTGPDLALVGHSIKHCSTAGRGLLSSFQLCHRCGKSFQRRATGLRAHLLKHQVDPSSSFDINDGPDDDNETVKCAECKNIFPAVSLLRTHWETTHGLRQERRGCFQCGLVFCNKAMLRVHSATCLEISGEGSRRSKKLLCRACGYTTTSLESFIKHADSEHASSESRCQLCDRSLPDRQSLNDHYEDEHSVPIQSCPTCGKTFRTLPGFKYHLTTHEPTQHCSICSFTTATAKNLQIHMKKHHPAALDAGADGTGETRDHLPHKCTECSAAYLYECLLLRHYRTKHLKLKPFKCPYCGHTTTEKAALQSHIRCAHTNERPFTCEICGYKGKTRSMLNRHRLVHTGEKPHACKECGAAFPEKKDLKAHHWKVHVKRQPFTCPLCNVGFLRKDNMLQHQRSKHGIV